MEIEVKVPENLSEITLGQYQKYLKIQDGDNDEMFIAQKMIEIFCNVELLLIYVNMCETCKRSAGNVCDKRTVNQTTLCRQCVKFDWH